MLRTLMPTTEAKHRLPVTTTHLVYHCNDRSTNTKRSLFLCRPTTKWFLSKVDAKPLVGSATRCEKLAPPYHESTCVCMWFLVQVCSCVCVRVFVCHKHCFNKTNTASTWQDSTMQHFEPNKNQCFRKSLKIKLCSVSAGLNSSAVMWFSSVPKTEIIIWTRYLSKKPIVSTCFSVDETIPHDL